MTAKSLWPDGKRFAFTVFDDTDSATLENVKGVYDFLADRGFRTTKSVWVAAGDPSRGKNAGQTCADPDYTRWLLDLQAKGFEIGFHNATWHGLEREAVRGPRQVRRALRPQSEGGRESYRRERRHLLGRRKTHRLAQAAL